MWETERYYLPKGNGIFSKFLSLFLPYFASYEFTGQGFNGDRIFYLKVRH